MTVTPFKERHLAGLPDSWPAAAQVRLKALGDPPNDPWTGQKGSVRMDIGIDPWAAQVPALKSVGFLTGPNASILQLADEGLQWWLSFEEETRGFPEQQAAAIAFHKDGSPWLNDKGEIIKPNQWDSLHLEGRRLLVIATCHPSAWVRKRAWKQHVWLRNSVMATMPGEVGKHPWLSGNAREIGWGLIFLVDAYRALPEPAVMVKLHELVEGLAWLSKDQHQTAPKGSVPFPVFNPNKQNDHDNKELCSWMILGPLLLGLLEVRALALELGSPADVVDRPIKDCLDFARVAFAKGEAATKLPGRLADDVALDPAQPPHIITPATYGALPPWALMGLAEADRQGLLDAELKEKAEALYDGCPFFDTGKPAWGADSKLLGLSILCAGWRGWRT